jgi:hypothetical protein
VHDPQFIEIASTKLHLPEKVHEEFDAAKAEG